MKKKYLGPIIGLILLLSVSVTNTNKLIAEPAKTYQLNTYFLYVNGILYLVYECTYQIGDVCTTPGVTLRIKISDSPQ